MNPLIQFRTTTLPALIVLVLACFGYPPLAEALLAPLPDGGYGGENTAEGTGALSSIFLFGRGAATDNTALGFDALTHDTHGSSNTAIGSDALFDNFIGNFNTATGTEALFHNTVDGNTADGYQALYNNTSGIYNTAIGTGTLVENVDGTRNTAIGFNALYGANGDSNTAIGFNALVGSGTVVGNTATGAVTLPFNNGNYNTADGHEALIFNTSGSFNTALGYSAGKAINTASNVICIGANVGGADVSNGCYIGNIWSQSGGSQAVYVNSEGKLGALVSSRRFKDEVKPMDQGSEVIYSLEPVSFRYKPEIEPTRPPGFGLIAEDVEKVSPDLVSRGSDGKANSVR
jgi:hypothetical protein